MIISKMRIGCIGQHTGRGMSKYCYVFEGFDAPTHFIMAIARDGLEVAQIKEKIPKEVPYIIYKIPLGKMVCNDKFKDAMGNLDHEHFNEPE